MTRTVRTRFIVPLALLALTPRLCLAQTAPFNIPAQPLSESLKAVGAQANVNVLVAPVLVDGKQAPALKAQLTVKDALAKLLERTGLEYHFVNDQTVVIRLKGQSVAGDPAPSGVASHDGDESTKKEAGKNSSPDFRVAQVDQASAGPQAVNDDKKQKNAKLEEIVVTGTRLKVAAPPQEVDIYTRTQIEQSGQTSISDFFNTLPYVSTATTEGGFQTPNGATTVRLHGLPVGTTLTLINGRRVETSGGTRGLGDFFDLSSIPIDAVERIEVVPQGSSAVYGSDAIGGVVNIVLKKDFSGFEASARYGAATGTDDADASFAWGHQWSQGSLSIIGSYQTRSELTGFERSITADEDFRKFGGIDARSFSCNPGNVFAMSGNLPGVGAPFAAVPTGFTGPPTQQEFAATAGTLNECSLNAYNSFIPETHRAGVFAAGNYALSPSSELFTELLFSHTEEINGETPIGLFGLPGFQVFTVPATNPYNPFGQTVGISNLLTSLGRSFNTQDTSFIRALVGARGKFSDQWDWEIDGWDVQDKESQVLTNPQNSLAIQNALDSSNPATALNPFVDGPLGSQTLLQSLLLPDQRNDFGGQTLAASGLVRGPAFSLPAGSVNMVVGGEYDYNKIDSSAPTATSQSTVNTRNTYAVFGEARIPLLARRESAPEGYMLAVTVAGRYDHYSDFGGKGTPQFGVEWRPLDSLLVRASYARSFKAPTLYELNAPVLEFPTTIADPKNGNQIVTVNEKFGGSPDLAPETGLSKSLGFIYSSKAIPNLQLAVTYWGIDEDNRITTLNDATLLGNEALFPGRVIRNSAGVLTGLDLSYLNFGEISVKGLDYQVNYSYQSAFGQFTPSLAATQTYHYTTALSPGSLPTDRVSQANDDGLFSPRWKGTVGLGWTNHGFNASVSGRYIGRYQDYDSTRLIGNFWIYDASFRYAPGSSFSSNHSWLKGTYVAVGGVNLFNKLPQYSNYEFGLLGYDPAESDLRGRFLYLQLGVRL